MSFTIVPFDQVIEIPEDVAVCPYCKAKLSAHCEGWVETADGTTKADHLSVDCANEPDIDNEEWDEWLEHHCQEPYIHQLPVDEKVKSWINERYRFDMETSSSPLHEFQVFLEK
jgi:hypothetical protein